MEECRTSAELAEKLCVAKSRVTRMLDGLVEKKLLIHNEVEKDRSMPN